MHPHRTGDYRQGVAGDRDPGEQQRPHPVTPEPGLAALELPRIDGEPAPIAEVLDESADSQFTTAPRVLPSVATAISQNVEPPAARLAVRVSSEANGTKVAARNADTNIVR